MAPPDLLLRGTSICAPSIFCLLHTSSPSHTYNTFVMMGRRFMFEVILNFLSNTYANRHVRKYLQLFVKPILEHLYFDHTYFIP